MSIVEPQMLKGVLALLLLRLCAEREDYGYSLVQRLRAAGLVDAVEGSVYPALARLESRGFLQPRMVREGRGPGRRFYRLTDEGTAELARLQLSWAGVAAVVRDVTRSSVVGEVDEPAGSPVEPPAQSREGIA